MLERFWKYVEKNGPDDCWEWTGGRKATGYGVFKVTTGVQARAHRFSYEIHTGKIPPGIHVLHKCDNRACVNPDHLFLGNHQDNMTDMANKGRSNVGEKNPKAKLSENDVRAIRDRLKSGEMCKDIAEDYPITYNAVRNAATGKTWKHLPI